MELVLCAYLSHLLYSMKLPKNFISMFGKWWTIQDAKFMWELDAQAEELCILDISVLFHALTLNLSLSLKFGWS
jgi:hypothetical protein